MIKKFVTTVLILILIMVFAGCSRQKEQLSKDNNDALETRNPPIETQHSKANGMMLYWLVDSGYTENMGEEVFNQFNQKLNEKGYDFRVKFIGKDSTDYKEYQKYINRAHKEKQKLDIIFTGYGVDGEKDTYDANIDNKNLSDMSAYLKTKNGKKLKQSFDDKMWKKVTHAKKIYGMYNARELSSTYYLILNKKYFKEKPGSKNWNIEEMKKVIKTLNYDSEDIGLYFPDEERYEVCKNKKQVDEFIEEGSAEGWLNISNEGLEKVYTGNFAMAVMDSYCNMIHNDKFVVDGKTIDVYTYKLNAKYIPSENNAITGVTSWSEQKQQAMELLYAVNTDAELSNILQYGILNKDYHLENGRVTQALSPMQMSPACPANQAITYPNGAEEADKQEMYREMNKKYQLLPKK